MRARRAPTPPRGRARTGRAKRRAARLNHNQAGRVQIRLERGSKVASDRYGRITVTGWDKDTVEPSPSRQGRAGGRPA